ncbi:MAG: diguanylate cyclase [Rhodospirillaceae bacterium]|jgi:diguanylate cyclase (GGDEF)-like protein|nr:diguanylate cyclase [Rhodospirillales bacterium]MBT3905688.1 diguanylate cyclase [Rhodospirillaceae bacterium]MBT4699961.1 diguanylate cyclase [Rhodospirillaceae bacterium]MBT5034319.1 diguanylate cyclase [Rhodospirillaceae bacterium]MBT6221715.1 diguanylate cyclase [Rhodospirillaceae bacterium]
MTVRILIIDDSPEDQETYHRFLETDEETEYKFIFADSGDAALEACEIEVPDCILLDYNLPDTDGLEFLSDAAHSDVYLAETAVIMLTGQGNENVAVEAMKRGAIDYLVKGEITQEQIRRSVHYALEKKVLEKELREARRRLEEMALEDSLTRIANRYVFEDRLNQALIRAERLDEKVGLFCFDLDKFKQVNDQYGHQAGDYVLREIAQRLLQVMRHSDTVARIGGDEFAVIMHTNVSIPGGEVLAEKVLEAVSQPIVYEGQTLNTGISIGFAVYPDHGKDGKSLHFAADAAMYEAKKSGGGYRVSSD